MGEIIKDKQIIDNEWVDDGNVYVPSQVDRKKASFMYILLWIFIYLSQSWKENEQDQKWNDKVFENVYLSYHIRQSIWIRTVIFVSLPVILLFSFISFFRYLVSFLLLLLEIVILIYSMKIAREWKYQQWKKSVFIFFYKLWSWVLELFS